MGFPNSTHYQVQKKSRCFSFLFLLLGNNNRNHAVRQWSTTRGKRTPQVEQGQAAPKPLHTPQSTHRAPITSQPAGVPPNFESGLLTTTVKEFVATNFVLQC